MLKTTMLPKQWWVSLFLDACHVLINRVSTNNEITPFEEWEKKRLKSILLAHLGLPGQGELGSNTE
jgi:hypothetical protein